MTKLIFVYGILQRSGTNFLNQILLLYPNCIQPVLKIRENWFLHYSDALYKYADQLFQVWSSPRWGGEDYSKAEFYSAIGDALITYISKGLPDLSDQALLSKTPSVQHLQRNFQMFPSSKIFIIIRDPRDVAASAFKSWNRPVEQTIRDWNIAAKTIIDFERYAPSNYYFLLRYEDLISNKEEWIRKCIHFLGFSESTYPWPAISELPVFGSSEEGGVWRVTVASPSFHPIGRWKALPSNQRYYFSRIESSFLNYFGYSDEGEFLPLPSSEDRLSKKIILANDTTLLASNENLLSRISKLRTALGLMAEAVFGVTTANYLRKSFTEKKGKK